MPKATINVNTTIDIVYKFDALTDVYMDNSKIRFEEIIMKDIKEILEEQLDESTTQILSEMLGESKAVVKAIESAIKAEKKGNNTPSFYEIIILICLYKSLESSSPSVIFLIWFSVRNQKRLLEKFTSSASFSS